jgi:hypothetical protein
MGSRSRQLQPRDSEEDRSAANPPPCAGVGASSTTRCAGQHDSPRPAGTYGSFIFSVASALRGGRESGCLLAYHSSAPTERGRYTNSETAVAPNVLARRRVRVRFVPNQFVGEFVIFVWLGPNIAETVDNIARLPGPSRRLRSADPSAAIAVWLFVIWVQLPC